MKTKIIISLAAILGWINICHAQWIDAGATLSTSDNVTITGSVNIGGEKNYRLRVRHIDGKHYLNSSVHQLYLNYNTSQPVYVGYGGKNSDLYVSGKIGIGTTSASSPLEVKGQITVSSSSGTLFYSSHTGVQTFKLTNDNLVGVNNILLNDDGMGEGIDWQNGRNISMFTVGQGGFNAFRFGTTASFPYVLEGGNVGIGVKNPTEKLVVDGKILAEEIIVQNVPSSDYVFETVYNLRSIHEVETFINENKHLPDIPSAEEFKENGVGLGEMDDMLLRKVEELTLYVIELKKEIEILKESR